MPSHYQLDDEEFALIKLYRKASPLTRQIFRDAVDEAAAAPDWVRVAIQAWRKAHG